MPKGSWLAKSYAFIYEDVMYKEPKERATHFHASDLCKVVWDLGEG